MFKEDASALFELHHVQTSKTSEQSKHFTELIYLTNTTLELNSFFAQFL